MGFEPRQYDIIGLMSQPQPYLVQAKHYDLKVSFDCWMPEIQCACFSRVITG